MIFQPRHKTNERELWAVSLEQYQMAVLVSIVQQATLKPVA